MCKPLLAWAPFAHRVWRGGQGALVNDDDEEWLICIRISSCLAYEASWLLAAYDHHRYETSLLTAPLTFMLLPSIAFGSGGGGL